MTVGLLRTGTLALVTFAVATAAAQQAPQQTPPPAPPPVTTGLILGRTVDGTSGAAIGGAIVMLSGGPIVPPAANAAANPGAPDPFSQFPIRVISDGSGRFVFHDLPPGVYSLMATKPPYLSAAFGRSAPTDTFSQALVLAEGDRRGDVMLKFWKVATISGRVVDEAGEPVIGMDMRVLKRSTVNGRPGFTQYGTATTDDRGIYRIASLPPGDYVVGIVTTQATVPTSMQEAFAAAAKSGTSADLQRDLDRSGDMMLGGSSLSGPGQRVGAWLLQTATNGRTPTNPPAGSGKVFIYPTVFYPAAPLPSRAMIVTLASGDNRTGVDFHLRPVVTSAVSGTLIGPNGPEPRTVLTLMPGGTEDLQRDSDFASASTVTDATGAFTFLGATPGAYTIRALKIPPRPVSLPSSFGTVIQTGSSTIYSGGGGPSTPAPIPDDPTMWAAAPVTVGESDVTGVAVSLRTGARIMGHLEFDGAAQPPAADRLGQVTVQVDTADGRSTSLNQFTLGRGVVDATGHFKTFQFPPGRYLVRASGAPGWSFKSATVNGRDISDAPLELGADDVNNVVVTFTDRPTSLSGAARDSKGPDAAATVLVFPAQAALWVNHGSSPRRFRAARVDTQGTYRVPNLPPGDYLVVAVRSGVSSDWQDTKYLQKLAALATRVTIADGEKKSVDVDAKEVR